jgi:lipopolysaccharide biosynthesis glycosyltransferase
VIEKYYSPAEIDSVLGDPRIIHYTGSTKPWHYMYDGLFKEKYWEYLRKTPWLNYKFDDRSLRNIIKKQMPASLVLSCRKFIKKIRRVTNTLSVD